MRVLLTGGRAPATLELARLFHRQGHVVMMAESLSNHLSAASRALERNFVVPPPWHTPDRFIEALLEIIQREHIELLLPTCEEIFWIARGYDRLASLCQVFCLPLPRLRPLHDKWDFIQRARGYGLCVPETSLITNRVQLAALEPPLVLKPVFSRFAAKTLFYDRAEPMPTFRPTSQQPWVAQRWMVGKQVCTYSVARQGRVLAHTCYPAHFTAGQGAAIHFRHIDHPAALQWVKNFVAEESFTGQIAFDFIETASGELFALECNPRATSGVHLLASNPDFANVFWGDPPDLITPAPDSSAMLTAAMLIYGLPAAFSTRTFTDWASAFTSARDVAFRWNDPLPALWQFVSLGTFMWRAHRYQVSVLEASTLDIEWNGEP